MKISLVVTLLTMTLLALSPAVGQADSDESASRVAVPPCGRGTLGERFVIIESGTGVCDNVSGVVWERITSSGAALRTLPQAQAWCSAKGPGWRLPGIKDFLALVDYANAFPPLPSGHPFTISVNGEYWTNTPVVDANPGDMWSFVLDWGRTFQIGAGGADHVWCAR